MDKYQIIWSLVINLICNAGFFILGWYLGKKPKFWARELLYSHNLKKARTLYQYGDIEKSLEEYNRIKENINEDSWFNESDFFNLAIIHKEKRNIPECMYYLNKIINKKITVPLRKRLEFTVLLLNNAYHSEAKEILLHGEAGNDSLWHSALAWTLSKNNDFDQANKEAEIAFKMADIKDYRTFNRCGLAFDATGLNEKAHQCYKKCLSSKDPTDKMWAYNNIGSLSSKKARERAKQYDFKNKNRFDKVAYNYLKKAFNILKEKKLWEKSIDPSSVVSNLIAETDDIDDKTDYIEFALKFAPYSVRLHTQIAWMYYHIKDYKNALNNAKKCYEFNPRDIGGLSVLSASYLKNRQFNKTISIAFEAWNYKKDIKSGYLEGCVAEAYEKLENASDAIRYYKMAIAKGLYNEKNCQHIYIKAINLSNWLKDFKGSISLCLEALLYFPKNKRIKDLLGKSLMKSGCSEIYNFDPFRNI